MPTPHLPSQDEYQHKLEFAHDGNSSGNSDQYKTSSSGEATGARKKTKTTLNGSGTLKGTSSRGRTLAVAADRKRAERALRNEGGISLGDNAGDMRDAQRARRVMQMQKQIQEGGHQRRSASTAGPGCGSYGGGGSGGGIGVVARGGVAAEAGARRPFHGRAEARWQERLGVRETTLNGEREVVEIGCDTDDEDASDPSSKKPLRHRTTAVGIGAAADGAASSSAAAFGAATIGATAVHAAAANRSSVSELRPTTTGVRTSVEAVVSWNDGDQRLGERNQDGWDCSVCTFRNLDALDAVCAICRSRRCP